MSPENVSRPLLPGQFCVNISPTRYPIILCGHLKDKVYIKQPVTFAELKQNIRKAIP